MAFLKNRLSQPQTTDQVQSYNEDPSYDAGTGAASMLPTPSKALPADQNPTPSTIPSGQDIFSAGQNLQNDIVQNDKNFPLHWTGAFDLNAMKSNAEGLGGPMPDQNYDWAGRESDFQQRYGAGWVDEMYQRMLGKGASGSDVRQVGPYAGVDAHLNPDGSPQGSTNFGLEAAMRGLGQAQSSLSSTSSSSSSVPSPSMPGGMDIQAILSKILTTPQDQSDIYTKRVGGARDALELQRSAELDTARAQLADRGLIGMGPEISAITKEGENIAGQFGSALAGIEGDLSSQENQRVISALSNATGLSETYITAAIQQYAAETGRIGTEGQLKNQAESNRISEELGLGNLGLGYYTAGNQYNLGLGNLALGNLNSENNYNLGVGQLGLNRDELAYTIMHDLNVDYETALQILNNTNNNANGGYK